METKTIHEIGAITAGPHFKLSGIPMPPSSNAQYWNQLMPSKHSGKMVGRPTPTGELKAYKKAIEEDWKNQNLVAVIKAKKMIRDWMMQGHYVGLYTLTFWGYFDLFTQKGTPKKFDVSNRLKALHDCLADVLEVDDSWLWSISAHKFETKAETPWCAVVLAPVEHMSLSDLKKRGIL